MLSIQLLLVDPQPILRRGVRWILESAPDIRVVEEAPDIQTASSIAGRIQPDVALLLLHGPVAEQLDAVHELRHFSPRTGVLVLGDADDKEALLHAARAGAAGYARQGSAPDDLIALVRHVAAGRYPIDDAVVGMPQVAAQVLSQFRVALAEREEAWRGFAPLSNRELQVLDCMARGMANKEIAQQLMISGQTVKNHITAILSKLHAGDRTSAVITAMRRGWVSVQRREG
jgi:DNA-binding NarL/FixJ family response regulator